MKKKTEHLTAARSLMEVVSEKSRGIVSLAGELQNAASVMRDADEFGRLKRKMEDLLTETETGLLSVNRELVLHLESEVDNHVARFAFPQDDSDQEVDRV